MFEIILVVGLVVIFIGVTILNTRTKVPEGIELPEKCEGCRIDSCKHKKEILTKEVVEEIKKDLACKEENNEGQ